jgi:hypothetical protein
MAIEYHGKILIVCGVSLINSLVWDGNLSGPA